RPGISACVSGACENVAPMPMAHSGSANGDVGPRRSMSWLQYGWFDVLYASGRFTIINTACARNGVPREPAESPAAPAKPAMSAGVACLPSFAIALLARDDACGDPCKKSEPAACAL